MVLTPAQRRVVNSLPTNRRAAATAGFNRQNSQRTASTTASVARFPRIPNRGRGRGRGRGRPQSRAPNNQLTRMRNISAPMNMGHFVERQQSNVIRLTRTFYLDSFNVPKVDAQITAQVVDIHPGNIPWLNQLTNLYGRYKFSSYRYRFVTAAATTLSGNVWAAFQPISTSTLPTSITDIQQLAQHKLGPVYKTWDVFASADPKLLRERWFRTTAQAQDGSGSVPDFADRVPGRVLFGTAGVTSNVAGGILGWLEVHVDITLSDPHTINFGAEDIIPPTNTSLILTIADQNDPNGNPPRTLTIRSMKVDVNPTNNLLILEYITQEGESLIEESNNVTVSGNIDPAHNNRFNVDNRMSQQGNAIRVISTSSGTAKPVNGQIIWLMNLGLNDSTRFTVDTVEVFPTTLPPSESSEFQLSRLIAAHLHDPQVLYQQFSPPNSHLTTQLETQSTSSFEDLTQSISQLTITKEAK